ncbi:zinc finger, CCHC-type containing protein [Tanacetum coccineum]
MRHSMRMLAKDTRSQDGKEDKDNDKGSKSRSQSIKEQAYNKEQRERPRPHELNDKSNLIDIMKESEDASTKKFLVSNFNIYKMVDSRSVMEQFNKLLRILGQYIQHSLKMDESISVSSVIDKLPPSWKDFKHSLKHGEDYLSLVKRGSHLRIEESLRAQESDKGKGKEVAGPSVNMMGNGGKNKNNKQNKGKKHGSKNTVVVLVPTRNLSWNIRNVARLVTLRGIAVVVDAIAWWINSGATTHVCKDRCWFKTYKPVEDEHVLYMCNDHFVPVHGKGSVMLEYNKQNKGKKRSNKNNSGSSSNKKPKLECSKCGKTGHFKRDCRSGFLNIVSLISEAFYVKVDAIAWWIDSGATTHVCKDRCWFKTFEPVEDGSVLYMGDEHFTPVHGKGSVALEFSSRKTVTFFNVLYVPKLHKNLVSGPVLNKCGYKQVYESDKYILSKCGVFIGFGYYNNGMFMLNLNKVLDDSDSVYMSSSSTVVNSSLWHARLGHVHYKRMLKMSKGIIHETTAPYTPLQNVAAERKNRALKEMVNSMLSNSGLSEGFWREAMAVVRLPDPKQKTLGEKESRDAIFDENHFSSIPRPKDIIPNLDESKRDDHSNEVPTIKSRFGGNDESKKMQKYILKQQFEGFTVSNSDGYTASSSNLQNVAFVSENTSSINEVSTAYGVSNTFGHYSKHEQTSSYSLLASQSSCPQLDHEDLDQVDEYDLEEMDLKWQVAMISMRIKKFYKKIGKKLQFDAKEPVGFDKTKVECYNCHKTGHFARECRTNEDNRRRMIESWK